MTPRGSPRRPTQHHRLFGPGSLLDPLPLRRLEAQADPFVSRASRSTKDKRRAISPAFALVGERQGHLAPLPLKPLVVVARPLAVLLHRVATAVVAAVPAVFAPVAPPATRGAYGSDHRGALRQRAESTHRRGPGGKSAHRGPATTATTAKKRLVLSMLCPPSDVMASPPRRPACLRQNIVTLAAKQGQAPKNTAQPRNVIVRNASLCCKEALGTERQR